MLNQLKLGPKFTLLLSIVLTIGILLSGLALWFRIQPEAEEDVAQRAEMLTQTMNSVRNYTSKNITPLLKEKLLTEREFVREIVPAFSARAVFEQFRNRPEYSSFFYKEASPNPTNLQDLTDEFEAELVTKFRVEPNLSTQSGYRSIEGKRLYYIARANASYPSRILSK